MEENSVKQSEPDKLSYYYKRSSTLLIVLSIAGVLSVAYAKKYSIGDTLNALIFLMIIDLLYISYLGLYREKVFAKDYAWWMISVSYLISILCMYPSLESGIPYWILGGVILACTIDLNAGLLMTYSLTVMTAWTYDIALNQLLINLVLCTLLCILTGFLRNIAQLIYINIIIISTGMTMLLAASGFDIQTVFSLNGIALVLFCVLVMILSYALKRIEDKWVMLSEDMDLSGVLLSADHVETEEYAGKECTEDEYTENEYTEKEEINKEKIEKEEVENNEIEIDEIEKEEIENKEIENKEIEKDEIEKDEIEKEGIENKEIEKDEIEKEEIQNEVFVKPVNELIRTNAADFIEDEIDNTGDDFIDFGLDTLKAEFELEKKLDEQKRINQSIKNIIKPDNLLLIRLKTENPKLYKHGKRVADISKDAARAIEADELIAYAGGFYHDVGKLNGNDFIEEGLKLAKENSFPECIEDMIKQSSIKSEHPKSREAAIIMLTDNILSALTFFKKQGENLSIEKAVDGTLDIRMSKGILDESGLSVREFNILKNYYLTRLKEINQPAEDKTAS